MKTTHKQMLLKALMSDKLVTQSKFNFKISRRMSCLRKDGYVIDKHDFENKRGCWYEINYKKTPKRLFK